jgi:hypothetical protein
MSSEAAMAHFFLCHTDRMHYYIKVVDSIQLVCIGNSGISHDLCNANIPRSIHEGLFFNSSPTLDLKYGHYENTHFLILLHDFF